jgi:hypothetical protein
MPRKAPVEWTGSHRFVAWIAVTVLLGLMPSAIFYVVQSHFKSPRSIYECLSPDHLMFFVIVLCATTALDLLPRTGDVKMLCSFVALAVTAFMAGVFLCISFLDGLSGLPTPEIHISSVKLGLSFAGPVLLLTVVLQILMCFGMTHRKGHVKQGATERQAKSRSLSSFGEERPPE